LEEKEMKLFSYKGDCIMLLVEAFNRGHACEQIAKFLKKENNGRPLNDSHPVEEVVLGQNKKGAIHLLDDPTAGL